ncbi:hypothetical protein ONS95_014990 [Cadophora gregata]|uniref:uncharacterized protein n=1 Tax=Cadophora gregata TaxID=51156 RepID=UPI0026DC8DDF|nr:uncharacterized protein ONS95_014990 [Cadophora gregata]KAK0103194.1 hypothetical protein ONS96_005799 [Cadophora gregata f. sp. sojae]KAK0113297.1 hypothetical protein ONS95_014990 [Cadophora gregata]
MLSTGFASAPVSRSLAYGIIATSLLASITDTKHYFYIQVDPHIWRYHQLWRILVYQLCYTNSTECLFAAMTVYNMRVIERVWGSRKFASFLAISYLLTTLLPPLLLTLLIRPLSLHTINYLPAGPTPLIFTLLAQYHAIIPHVYKYRLAASPYNPTTSEPFVGLTFSDKSYVYLPAVQLSLSQFPGSFLCATVGWVVGYSWRNEVLPGRLTRWRVPAWVVGEVVRKRGEDFEGLRRRLEGEGTSGEQAAVTGSDGRLGGEVGRRRPLARQLVDQFRGAF